LSLFWADADRKSRHQAIRDSAFAAATDRKKSVSTRSSYHYYPFRGVVTEFKFIFPKGNLSSDHYRIFKKKSRQIGSTISPHIGLKTNTFWYKNRIVIILKLS